MSYNPFSLKDKTILVTGASSGIGRAIAIQCSKMGAKVYITARNRERLEETLKLMEHPNLHKMILADISIAEERKQIINFIDEKLDGMVQCAGLTITKPFAFISEDELNYIMNTNFTAPVFLSQGLLKQKKVNREASIVFISSISGVYVTLPGNGMYSASKGAINGIVKNMALELAAKKIRVNCVNPGMVNTEILSKGIISLSQLEEDKKKYPLKRYGEPDEVAFAVIYLLSDASKWVTGTNLKIDGGLTLI